MTDTGRSTVHLTRIWTRTGDDGTTALGDGSRVPKTDPRVAALAEVDATNAAIGVALALGGLDRVATGLLAVVQNELFDLGADLAVPAAAEPRRAPLRVGQDAVAGLERACDRVNADLPALHSFVLPGGNAGAALLHAARTEARRAERAVWLLAGRTEVNPWTARYLNRLSDLLFVLARSAAGGTEVTWVPADRRDQSG